MRAAFGHAVAALRRTPCCDQAGDNFARHGGAGDAEAAQPAEASEIAAPHFREQVDGIRRHADQKAGAGFHDPIGEACAARAKRGFEHSELARFTQIDYDREMAFIATTTNSAGIPETLAVARAIADPDNRSAEFAILVRSDLKGQGLGHALLGKMIRYCRARGTREIIGEVLTGNAPMLALAASHGLKAQNIPADPSVVRISLRLNSELPDLAAELELGGLVAYGPSISDL